MKRWPRSTTSISNNPMFLIDTNCWMQIARDRSQADEVRLLFAGVPLSNLFISIFSVHSIGAVLSRRGWIAGYADFLTRVSIGGDVNVLAVPVNELQRVEDACLAHQLDF